MAKSFTCDVCGEDLVGDRESVLVDEVKQHAKEAHGIDMEEEQIRQEIEDT